MNVCTCTRKGELEGRARLLLGLADAMPGLAYGSMRAHSARCSVCERESVCGLVRECECG